MAHEKYEKRKKDMTENENAEVTPFKNTGNYRVE